MQFQYFRPPELLQNWVWCYWVMEGNASTDQPFINHPPASTFTNLLFHYKGGFESRSFDGKTENTFLTGIHAHTDKHRQICIKEEFGIFGVFLYPYAFPDLFGISASDITNVLSDLHSLLGMEGRELEEQIILANNSGDRLELINAFLLNKARSSRDPAITRAIHHIYRHHGQINLNELAGQTYLSSRQFERKFRQYGGFTPKKFSRIVRFNSLVHHNKKDYDSLSQLAYDFGYYDQSHFIQEFREFSGINPRAFFNGMLNHAFIPE